MWPAVSFPCSECETLDNMSCLYRDDCGRTALHWAAAAGLESVLAPLTAAVQAVHERRMQAYRVDVESLAAIGVEAPPPPATPTPAPEMQASQATLRRADLRRANSAAPPHTSP